jgi:hypothetical protein
MTGWFGEYDHLCGFVLLKPRFDLPGGILWPTQFRACAPGAENGIKRIVVHGGPARALTCQDLSQKEPLLLLNQ